MKLIDYTDLIHELPVKEHSFTIKKNNWTNQHQQELIDNIFQKESSITLNRYDLTNSNHSIEEFILKTLMWGYPIKGRGNNIDNLLEPDNFERLKKTLEGYTSKNIVPIQLQKDIKSIKGLGLSTMSKFLCFMNARVENQSALILDRRIIEILNLNVFEELRHLKRLTYPSSVSNYVLYLDTLNKFAEDNNIESENVEMFIFIFGKHLSPLQGENCYDDLDDFEQSKTDNYRNKIIKSIETLLNFDEELFINGLNLIMKNELKEVDEVFEIGDVYTFNLNHLSTSSDKNVTLIADLIENVRNTVDTLMNINAIKDEEVNID